MQSTFTAGELSPALHGRIDLAKYQTGLKKAKNVFVHAHGGVSNRAGFRYLASTKHVNGNVVLMPFSFNSADTYMLEFGHNYMRVFRNSAQVVYPAGHVSEGQIVEIVSPYNESDLLNLRRVQSGDTTYIACLGYDLRALKRTDHHEWNFTTTSFNAKPSDVTGLAVVAAGFTSPDRVRKYAVTQVDASGRESAAPVDVSANVSTNWPAAAKVTINWTPALGADYYNIYTALEGDTFGYIGTADTNKFVDDNIMPDISDPLKKHEYSFSVNDGDEPTVIGFQEQRLMLGATPNNPQSVYVSKTGDFTNFQYTSPHKVSDAFDFKISSGVINEVRHLISFDDLVVMTAGAEHRVSSGDAGFAFENLSSKPQGERGASTLQPIKVGQNILYTLPREKTVQALSYSDQSKGYAGVDVSILSKHLIRDHNIVSWCYQQEPDSIIWAVRSDGALLSFTYVREHEVTGWCWHETLGQFQHVANVEEGDQDVVYAVVKRNVNGSDVRFIERLEKREITDVRDAFFVDSGLSYEGSPVSTITGLDHLEGEEVVALADGNVVRGLTVAGGKIDLPEKASKVHAGLPYQSEIQTLEVPSEGIIGKKKSVSLVRIMFELSRGFWAGTDQDHMTELKQRSDEAWGDPIELFTGKDEIVINSDWGSNGELTIQQLDPLPVTILAISPDFDTE